MSAKLDPFAASPQLMKGWMDFSTVANASLDPGLAELVRIRASQINGCANCLNMHAVAARAAGERAQRLDLLSAWQDAPCYLDRERAALGWTEALTRLSEGHCHAAAHKALKAHFSDGEQLNLTLIINVINGWNRLATGFDLWVEPEAPEPAGQPAAGSPEAVN